MIVFLHEQHIRHSQYYTCTNEVDPMRQHCIRTQIDEAKCYCQLHRHIDECDSNMPHIQLVTHQLESMFAVCLAQILVQHDAVDDGQTTIHTINQQENHIGNITRLDNQPAQRKQHDKRDADAAHITRKAFRFTLRSEVENAEHQHTDDSHHPVTRFNKLGNISLLPSYISHQQW